MTALLCAAGIVACSSDPDFDNSDLSNSALGESEFELRNASCPRSLGT